MRFWRLIPVFLFLAHGAALCPAVWAVSADDRLFLQDPDAAASRSAADLPFHPLALGLSYLGAQVRWRWSSRWAVEFQYQRGSAASRYGDVTAQVYGLRAYHFFHRRTRAPLYVGSQIAYAAAVTEGAAYKTAGPVIGAFGGVEYYLLSRLSLGMDVGPYVISLKESVSGLTQTNLDFVVNTTVNWHLF